MAGQPVSAARLNEVGPVGRPERALAVLDQEGRPLTPSTVLCLGVGYRAPVRSRSSLWHCLRRLQTPRHRGALCVGYRTPTIKLRKDFCFPLARLAAVPGEAGLSDGLDAIKGPPPRTGAVFYRDPNSAFGSLNSLSWRMTLRVTTHRGCVLPA